MGTLRTIAAVKYKCAPSAVKTTKLAKKMRKLRASIAKVTTRQTAKNAQSGKKKSISKKQ
jgi:hypothetical protein